MSRNLRGGSPKSRGHDVYHIRQSNQRFRRELKTSAPDRELYRPDGINWDRVGAVVIALVILGFLIW